MHPLFPVDYWSEKLKFKVSYVCACVMLAWVLHYIKVKKRKHPSEINSIGDKTLRKEGKGQKETTTNKTLKST